MSELINVTSKPSTVQAFQLQSPEDMLAALKYINAGGYTGSIDLIPNDPNAAGWQLRIRSNVVGIDTTSTALINDWITIENNTVVAVVKAGVFGNLYQTP